MAKVIILKNRYLKSLEKLMIYLHENWGESIALDFIKLVDSKILLLSSQPNIGIRSDKLKDARSILITKHNRLIYRVKDNTLIILNLSDTRRHPKKNKH
ncbi:type II toxin-antitoxin system RelE/ParE family toxin [Parasediminibacterium paludis]|uniref:Type II toxin-antitoxin system RelE/ParE family toxin n=1 Tax=Parasediminibacterium paludis TaxID=908966 RepID=A0ABV8PRL4_9BACT